MKLLNDAYDYLTGAYTTLIKESLRDGGSPYALIETIPSYKYSDRRISPNRIKIKGHLNYKCEHCGTVEQIYFDQKFVDKIHHPDYTNESTEIINLTEWYPKEVFCVKCKQTTQIQKGISAEIYPMERNLKLNTRYLEFKNYQEFNDGNIKEEPKFEVRCYEYTVILAEDRKVKVGRNDKCPCGSGKKYKLCCGR